MKEKFDKLKNCFKIFSVLAFAMCLFLCGCGENTASVEVDGIEISKKNLYMAEGQTATLTAQVFPFNANNQNYTFESSNPNIVTIEDGFVTAKKAGDAVIYVFSEEGGYKDSCNVLVTTVANNLTLNNYNNLNMPARDLEPIYNSDDYVKNSKAENLSNQTKIANSKFENQNRKLQNNQTTKQNFEFQTKNNNRFNNLKNKKFDQNFEKISKKSEKNSKNTPKTLNFKNFLDDVVQRVGAEVDDDLTTTRNVFEDLKAELNTSISNLSKEKEKFFEISQNTTDMLFQSIKNLQQDMFDVAQNIQTDMIKNIEDIQEKVESGEYTVEPNEINGVTFVVIKNDNLENNE